MTVKEHVDYCVKKGVYINSRRPLYISTKRSRYYRGKMTSLSWYFNEDRTKVELRVEGQWTWRWYSINSVSFAPPPKRNSL